MIVDIASYIGAIDLTSNGAGELVYPFQRHLGIDLRTLSASQSEPYSDLKNLLSQFAEEATENMAILFVLSQAESKEISVGIEVIGKISKSKNILTVGIFQMKFSGGTRTPWDSTTLRFS